LQHTTAFASVRVVFVQAAAGFQAALLEEPYVLARNMHNTLRKGPTSSIRMNIYVINIYAQTLFYKLHWIYFELHTSLRFLRWT